MKISKIGTAALLALLVAASAALVAGCGGGDGDSPETVVEDFYAALEDGDAGAACDLLSSSAVEDSTAGGGSCEEVFQQTIDSGTIAAAFGAIGDIEIGEASIDGDTATVDITAGDQEDEVPLVKEDGDWKIDLEG